MFSRLMDWLLLRRLRTTSRLRGERGSKACLLYTSKRAKLYVKPEEGKAYYVVNEGLKNGSTGAVDL